jgi:hypothetical protein
VKSPVLLTILVAIGLGMPAAAQQLSEQDSTGWHRRGR